MNDDNCAIRLTNKPINVQEALDFIKSPHCGGSSIFVGSTRITENDKSSDKKVKYLTYEAYGEMAIATMRKIVSELIDKCRYHRVYVCHRIGQVDLGQDSIVIAVSSPHRSSCHQLTMKILDEVKQKVPIWKKVYFDDDSLSTNNWSTNSEAFWLK
ncbi:Molybdopterin synthase catalytic subunit [Blomia tropicalis]|nr:Molybdopterin synthase catalytic subunit [Blomia tropicalis]